MKRKDKTPDAILMADGHMRDKQPICRIDDFVNVSQWQAWDFVKSLQEMYKCPVFNAGDLFHYWKPSPWLLTKAMNYLPNNFWTIYGDHDQPGKTMELYEKSGIETLRKAKALNVLRCTHYGQEVEMESYALGRTKDKTISVQHRFVWDGKNIPWPECEEKTADEMLDEYPDFDLIVTGDYHKGFTRKKDGRLLVNPGCLTRQVADYKDYQPRIYLWYAESNTAEPVYLPIEGGVISREHIETIEKHNERMNAFVERLNDKWETSVSFEENMKRFLSNNKVQGRTEKIVLNAIDYE